MQKESMKYLYIIGIDQYQLNMLLGNKHKDTIAVFLFGLALLSNDQWEMLDFIYS